MVNEPEMWLPIAGWPYEVSDLGRVRNSSGRVLAFRRHSNGYTRVSLCCRGKVLDFYVHRLVCETFIGLAPADAPEVDHINADRADNRLQNLRWISVRANRDRRRPRLSIKTGLGDRTAEAVAVIRSANSSRLDTHFARQYGISSAHVRAIRLRRRWRNYV